MSSELILDALMAATAVVSVAWLAAVAARRAPAALRNTLWRMALVGFWLAPAIVIATHAAPWQPHTIAVPLLPAAQEAAQAMPPGSDLSATAAPLTPASTIPRAPTPPERTTPPRHIPPVSLLLLLWTAGVALGIVYLIRDLRAVRRLILATRPLDDPALQQRVTALAAQLGLRTSPAVAASSAISTPTVAGQGVPVLLLPEDFSSAPGSDDAVIVHELAHIRRGDLLLYSAARLTRALWWWHPLAWLMARELVLSAEEACDDWAVALTGQRKDYATTLVDWAEAATAVAGLPCAPRGRALVKRVRHILQTTQAPRLHLSWQARTILAICAVGMVVLVGTVHLRAVPADEIMLAQAEAQVDDPTRTIAKGLENQEALLQTIECTLAHTSFIGPAHPRRDNRTDSGLVIFCMADMTRDRWLAERRAYYRGADNTLQSREHDVNIWNEGIWAYKSIDRDSAVWETDTKEDPGILKYTILQDMLFMSRLSPKMMLAGSQDTVTEEVVDGAECFRLQGTGKMSPELTGYVLHWVDPNRGFAVRKWAWLHVRDADGRVIVDTIGHAYDFREYDGGLWLPMRTKIIRSQLDERSVRMWVQLDLYNCVEIKVNQQLSDTIPRIESEAPRIPYQARLTDDNEDELKRQGEFLEQWRAGAKDPNTFMEPLPDLAEAGER